MYMYMYMHVCIYMCIYIHTYVHTYKNEYVHIYTGGWRSSPMASRQLGANGRVWRFRGVGFIGLSFS